MSIKAENDAAIYEAGLENKYNSNSICSVFGYSNSLIQLSTVSLQGFNMNVKFLMLISTISLVNAEKSSQENSENEKKYSSIKFISEGNSFYLPLSDSIQLTKKQKLYCACPKNSMDEIARRWASEENYCSEDYAPLFNENFVSCGPNSYGDLKIYYYMGKLDSSAGKLYKLNVFQICKENTDSIPSFAFASYNILSHIKSDSPIFEDLSQLLPENLRELYTKKTEKYRTTMKTEDTLVPQRLVPLKSIPQWFSKGTTETFHNLMPQWKAKFSKWTHITGIVENKARDNDFNVIAGVSLEEFVIDAERVPDYWWIIIRNPTKKKAIILVMDNKPDEQASKKKLCPTIDLKKTMWKDIRSNENDTFIYVCKLTSSLFEDLINLETNISYSLFDEEIPLTEKRKNMQNLSLIYG